MQVPETECVKVASLRKRYGEDINLEEWLSDENNLYVGRRGRIFIDGNIFHYPQSDWANPYKVSPTCTLGESLRLYEEHIKNSGMIDRLDELSGKNLGCFCETASMKTGKRDCHTKVLVKLFKRAYC